MDEKNIPSESKPTTDDSLNNPCTENAEECSAHEFELTKSAED